MNDKLNFIYQLPLLFKLGFYLVNQKYDKLEVVCKKRLENNPDDYVAIFYLKDSYAS